MDDVIERLSSAARATLATANLTVAKSERLQPMDALRLTAAVVPALLLAWCMLSYSSVLLRRWKLRKLPRARGALPFLGHALEVASHPTPWDRMVAWCDDYNGDFVHWWLPFTDWVTVRGGPAMRAVFQTRFKYFEKETAMSFHPFLCILGTGLVTSHGELWASQRKLMTPALKGDILTRVIEITRRATARLMAKLDSCHAEKQAIELDEEFRLLTLQVITEALMSMPHEESDRVFPRLYLPIMTECNKRVFQPWRPYMVWTRTWWNHVRMNAQLNKYMKGFMRERWSQVSGLASDEIPQRDLLDLLLSDIISRGKTFDGPAETQLCYDLKTFVLAGHETSATMLTYTIMELISNDSLAAKVVSEARAVLGADGSRVPTRQQVEEGMAFTAACLQESLRKYSVVPVVARTANSDTDICGHFIPKGTNITVHIQGTHAMWDSPEEYRPQRFMPGGEFDSFPEEYRRFMFVPFGQGPRVCIGQHFSLMESRVVVGLLLLRYRMKLERPYKLEWEPNVIPLQATNGVPVTIPELCPQA